MKALLLFLAIAICAGTGWSVYQSSIAASQAVEPAPPAKPPAVRIASAGREIVTDRIELVGSLEPQRSVEVRAAAAGYVVKLPVDLGDFVEAGAIVAELDDAEAREGVSRSEAALRVAQARLVAQQATAEHARSEMLRWQRLEESGVSTGQQLDAAKAAVAVADAQADLEQAQVEQVKAELEQSRLLLEQTRIRAPSAGYVAARLVSVGHLAMPDLPLLQLVSIATVRTVVHVPEQDYSRIRTGQAATVSVEALPQRDFSGSVVRKAPILDPATRTAAVEIEIPNPEALLKPGMYARVGIVFDERPATVVPLSALREDDLGRALFVVSGDPPTARRVAVETGVFDRGLVEIQSGIAVDDLVVTLGHDQITDGGPVQIVGDRPATKFVAEEPTATKTVEGDSG